MYPGMGPAYENTRMRISGGNYNTFKEFLKPGDELRTPNNGNRLWTSSTAGKFLTSKNLPIYKLPKVDYLVYSSGCKNLLNDKAGQVITWNYNPLASGSYIDFNQNAILNSSVIEYDDVAVNYCSYCPPTDIMDPSDEPPVPDDPIIDPVYQTPTQPDEMIYQIPQDGAQGWNNNSPVSPVPDLPQYPLELSGSDNPFLFGRKGTWKSKTSRFFLTERTQGDLNTGIDDIRTQGLFKNYNDFWIVPQNKNAWGKDYNNWEWNETINMVDADGQTIETEDRIGRKTSSLLGYKNTVILAQASNAGYHEIFYDGFEDYQNSTCPSYSNYSDFSKRVSTTGSATIVATESHTGKYSLQVPGTVELSPLAPVATNNAGCIGGWYPYNTQSDITYLFSCWVKVDKTKPVLTCSDASVVILSAGKTLTLHSDGPVIEGWQRIMGTFVVGRQNLNIKISLEKGTAATYFDDLRIIPFDANMTAYVYDDLNLRLTYILDENNYFSRYEYNNQGELIRIKKETEEGIMTIQESYQALVKKRN